MHPPLCFLALLCSCFFLCVRIYCKRDKDWLAGKDFFSVWASAIKFKYTFISEKPGRFVSITCFVELSTALDSSDFSRPGSGQGLASSPSPSLEKRPSQCSQCSSRAALESQCWTVRILSWQGMCFVLSTVITYTSFYLPHLEEEIDSSLNKFLPRAAGVHREGLSFWRDDGERGYLSKCVNLDLEPTVVTSTVLASLDAYPIACST